MSYGTVKHAVPFFSQALCMPPAVRGEASFDRSTARALPL
jgi:hypothetical protein